MSFEKYQIILKMIKFSIILFILICILYILNSCVIEHYDEQDKTSAPIPLIMIFLIPLIQNN